MEQDLIGSLNVGAAPVGSDGPLLILGAAMLTPPRASLATEGPMGADGAPPHQPWEALPPRSQPTFGVSPDLHAPLGHGW